MYLGDVAAGVTLTHRFHTEDPTGAPITLAGTPSAQVRKGTGSGTVITAGVSLTVDVVTGQHCVDVDLSASGSYAVANDYAIELAAGTVSGVSVVGKVLATFSIANRTTTRLFTTALTESYNADGAAPTPAQALFVIMQRLTDFAISGTAISVKKLDGSTEALVLTLDDADAPTSSTRSA